MGTGRKSGKKSMTRPIKARSAKLQRRSVQKKRLLGFGVDEAKVNKMNTREIRDMLKYPAKISSTQ